MRKKELIAALHMARDRISRLEDLICPAHQHKWYADHMQEVYVCVKCRKVVVMDEPFPNP